MPFPRNDTVNKFLVLSCLTKMFNRYFRAKNNNQKEPFPGYRNSLGALEMAEARLIAGSSLPRNRIPSWLIPECKPYWDTRKGEVSYRGRVIRRVKSSGTAIRIVHILNAFQAKDWEHRVETDFKIAKHCQDAVASLNETCLLIRFHSDCEGNPKPKTYVRWTERK